MNPDPQPSSALGGVFSLADAPVVQPRLLMQYHLLGEQVHYRQC